MNNPFLVIDNRLSRIEEILLDLKYQTATPTPAPDDDKYHPIEWAQEFLGGIARQTIYQNIDRIPHKKKHGRLLFRKSDLIAYLEEGAVQSKKGGKQ